MLARPHTRLVQSKTDAALLFGAAVQDLVDRGDSVAYVLTMLASTQPKNLAEATNIARTLKAMDAMDDEW